MWQLVLYKRQHKAYLTLIVINCYHKITTRQISQAWKLQLQGSLIEWCRARYIKSRVSQHFYLKRPTRVLLFGKKYMGCIFWPFAAFYAFATIII